jgi:arginine utilization regulatory protein
MDYIFDMAFLLDEGATVRRVEFGSSLGTDDTVRKACAALIGKQLADQPEIQWNKEKGEVIWLNRRFSYTLCSMLYGSCVLMRLEPVREKLMKAALDGSDDIIQLYSKDGMIQFFNKASKVFLGIPLKESAAGQQLLDVFNLDPDYSSVFTALKTQNSVYNRFDRYKSTTGKDLMTVVEAHPVFREDGSLLGAYSVERDMNSVKHQIPKLRHIEEILTSHMTDHLAGNRDVRYSFDNLIGSSKALQDAITLAKQMAVKDINILIQGETGSGKEIFAQSIHRFSSRRKEKFIAVNCAAFPESLIESMLFGTVKGAFTGSVDQMGLIEAANHGTLFLDEVNSMSPMMQAKLLRVLQEHTLQRIGSTKYIPVDVRVISSSNEDLYRLSENGKIRQDLFYRLASVVIEIPPLRSRMEDLPELVDYFIKNHPQYAGRPVRELTPAFWKRLREHNWPGNVRELFHILGYAMSVSSDGVLDEDDLPSYFLRHTEEKRPSSQPKPLESSTAEEKGLTELMDEFERNILWETYLACGKNVTKAAERLKMTRQNYQYHLRKFGIKTDQGR